MTGVGGVGVGTLFVGGEKISTGCLLEEVTTSLLEEVLAIYAMLTATCQLAYIPTHDASLTI